MGKKIMAKMNKKRVFNILFCLTTFSLAATPAVFVNNVNSISKNGIDNHAISNEESTITISKVNRPSWAGQKFVDEVTNDDIKSLLVPNKEYGVNFSVKILPITESMRAQGYVEFVVKQIKLSYDQGVPGGPVEVKPSQKAATSTQAAESVYILPAENFNKYENTVIAKTEVDNEEIENKYIWTTEKEKGGKGFFREKKYSFNWNSDIEIGNFLKLTEKGSLSNEDIMNNFVSKSDAVDFIPSTTKGNFDQKNIISSKTISDSTPILDKISEEDAKKYGVGKVWVTFYDNNPTPQPAPPTRNGQTPQNQDENNWVGNQIPNESQTTKIVRGLRGTEGSKHTVSLNIDKGYTELFGKQFSLSKIKKQNPSFDFESTQDAFTINDLTPSQVMNALNGDLLSLLATTEYLADSEKTLVPAIYPTYMDRNAFVDKDNNKLELPFNGTGLSHQKNIGYVDDEYKPIIKNGTQLTTGEISVNNKIKVTGITGRADDSTGDLHIKVKYDYYDVYKNVIVSDYEDSYLIKNLKINKDAEKNLFFNWKTNEDLPFNSSQEFINSYENNKNDQDYLRELTNSLFFGTNDTYEKERKVEITENGNKSVHVKLTFLTFGGNKEKVFEKDFEFKKGSTSSTVRFNKQDDVKNRIPGYSSLTPDLLINQISEGKIPMDVFITSGYNARANDQVLITSNSSNDGIIIQVNKGDDIFWNSYNGLEKGNNQNHIYDFSFTPTQSDSNFKTLMNIPIEKITKQDVIDLYLKNLDLFKFGGKQFELKPENIEIQPDIEKGILTVSVTIPQYNVGEEEVNRTFKTTILGFNNEKIVNADSYKKPLDLTVPLTASLGAVTVIALGAVLAYMIIKRIRLANARKQKKDE